MIDYNIKRFSPILILFFKYVSMLMSEIDKLMSEIDKKQFFMQVAELNFYPAVSENFQ